MIGHFVNNLPTVGEDRVMTRTFEPQLRRFRARAGLKPFRNHAEGCQQCLVAVATDGAEMFDSYHFPATDHSPGTRYEELVGRFGLERINRAVRNRVLANQARRVLTGRVVRCDAEQVPA